MPDSALTVQPVGDFRLTITSKGRFEDAELVCSALSYEMSINKMHALSMRVSAGASLMNIGKKAVAKELIEALQVNKANSNGSLMECAVHEVKKDSARCIFKGYICSCSLVYHTGLAGSSSEYKIDCLGYAAKLLIQPVSSFIETDMGNVLRRMQHEHTIDFDTAKRSGDNYAEQQVLLPMFLAKSIDGKPIKDRVSKCVAVARECSSFKDLKKDAEDTKPDNDVEKAFGGVTNLKIQNVGLECDDSYSIELAKDLMTAMQSTSVFNAIAGVLTSTDFGLELYPRWTCDDEEDFRIDIAPVTAWKPRKIINLDTRDVISVSSAYNSTEDLNTPDIVFVNFDDVYAFTRSTTESSLASIFGVSAFDKELRESLQKKNGDDAARKELNRDLGKIYKVREFSAPKWCAMLAANEVAVIDNLNKNNKPPKQPKKLKERNTSTQDTLTVNLADDAGTALALANKLATALMYYLYKSENTAVVELLPSLRFGLKPGKFMENSLGDTVVIKLDNSNIMESSITVKGVLRSIRFDYRAGDSSSLKYTVVLERVRVVTEEDGDDVQEESPIYSIGK